MTIVGSRGAGTLEAATGWTLKPEGLCRDEACMLVPDDARADPASVWRALGWPVAVSGDDVYLGEGAAARADALLGTVAPDFTLQDITGASHSLSDHRGKKVFLASWAPW